LKGCGDGGFSENCGLAGAQAWVVFHGESSNVIFAERRCGNRLPGRLRYKGGVEMYPGITPP
jgi:hypothetical protein